MTFVSYAQNFEDVMLWRALKHVENGQYLDIGASDPVIDSVSLSFYQRGWRGINVEPISAHAAALRIARPGDTVLELAIGEERGTISFFNVGEGYGISTCDPTLAATHAAAGFKVSRSEVSSVRLSDLFDEHVRGEVHWMKIDVEGLEGGVIRSWTPSAVRPWIVVVESTVPMTPIPNYEEWEPSLVALGYRFVYFDGLNRFYISEQHPELAGSFNSGPNYFDYFVLGPWSWMRPPLDNANVGDKISPEGAPVPPSLPPPTPPLTLRDRWRPIRRRIKRAVKEVFGARPAGTTPGPIQQSVQPVIPPATRRLHNLLQRARLQRGQF